MRSQKGGRLVPSIFFHDSGGFCTHLNGNLRRRSALFKATIAKLIVLDIALRLWIFAAIAKDAFDRGNLELCYAMEAELRVKMSERPLPKRRWLLTAIVTTCFLIDVGINGFCETHYPLMVDCCGSTCFKDIWYALDKSGEYSELRGCLKQAMKEKRVTREERRRHAVVFDG